MTAVEEKLLPVGDVQEAPWNVNVMPKEIYQQLLNDMKQVGPEGIDPIHVALVQFDKPAPEKPEYKLTTIDGAQRLHGAKDLGWKEVHTAYHGNMTEEEARLFNYKRDAERGEIDQFRLAESFKWFTEKGVKQEDIAKRFGIDRSTVTKRLSLLNLDPVVKGIAVDQDLTVSHLEPLASAEPDVQKAVIKDLRDRGWGYDPNQRPSVKTIERAVKDVEGLKKELQRFNELFKKAKFPKCPDCGKPARFQRFQGISRFHCENYHSWDPMKGKEAPPKTVFSEKLQRQVTKEVARLPAHVKIKETTEEVDAAAWGFIKELFPKIKRIETTESGIVGQLKDGRRFSLKFSVAGHSYGVNGRFTYECAGDDRIWFTYGAVSKSTPGYAKGLRTRFSGLGMVTSKKVLDKWEGEANEFLHNYGGSKK